MMPIKLSSFLRNRGMQKRNVIKVGPAFGRPQKTDDPFPALWGSHSHWCRFSMNQSNGFLKWESLIPRLDIIPGAQHRRLIYLLVCG
jgi:hypothetical protein